MPAQKREARKNYIDLVSDEAGPSGLVRSEPVPAHALKDYLRALVTDILKARHGSHGAR